MRGNLGSALFGVGAKAGSGLCLRQARPTAGQILVAGRCVDYGVRLCAKSRLRLLGTGEAGREAQWHTRRTPVFRDGCAVRSWLFILSSSFLSPSVCVSLSFCLSFYVCVCLRRIRLVVIWCDGCGGPMMEVGLFRWVTWKKRCMPAIWAMYRAGAY